MPSGKYGRRYPLTLRQNQGGTAGEIDRQLAIGIVDGRLYIANSVISEANPANQAAAERMLSSIKVAK